MTKWRVMRTAEEWVDVNARTEEKAIELAEEMPIEYWMREIKEIYAEDIDPSDGRASNEVNPSKCGVCGKTHTIIIHGSPSIK